jgi:hypothetical protein
MEIAIKSSFFHSLGMRAYIGGTCLTAVARDASK